MTFLVCRFHSSLTICAIFHHCRATDQRLRAIACKRRSSRIKNAAAARHQRLFLVSRPLCSKVFFSLKTKCAREHRMLAFIFVQHLPKRENNTQHGKIMFELVLIAGWCRRCVQGSSAWRAQRSVASRRTWSCTWRPSSMAATWLAPPKSLRGSAPATSPRSSAPSSPTPSWATTTPSSSPSPSTFLYVLDLHLDPWHAHY